MCAHPQAQVLYPDAVQLNRGNHETRQQNRLMGFEVRVCVGNSQQSITVRVLLSLLLVVLINSTTTCSHMSDAAVAICNTAAKQCFTVVASRCRSG
jgi:hypothetical protein